MSEIITTLHEKGQATNEVYPNIKSDNIPTGAVTTPKIADGAVSTYKLADRCVTTDKIGLGVVRTENIEDSAVTTAKLMADSVTTLKIADDAITEGKIKNNAVTEDKIKNNAVTEDKIKNNSINSNQIKDHVILPNHLAFNLFSYLGGQLEFTDNGDNIVLIIPPIITTNDIVDTDELVTDISLFIETWFSYYYDTQVYMRGRINSTWYDADITISDPTDTSFDVNINGNTYTINSLNYRFVDCQKITLIELR